MRHPVVFVLFLLGCTPQGALLYTEPTPASLPSPPPPTPEEPDDDPVFHPTGRTFVDPISLEIASDPSGHPVVFTEDGTLPTTPAGEAYDGPLLVRTSSRFHAFVDYVFEVPEGETDPGPDINTHGYMRIDDRIADFESNLPLALVHTFDSREIESSATEFQPAHFMLLAPDEDGVTSLVGEAHVDTPLGIKVRGSSTRNQDKHQYRIEFQDAEGSDKGYEPLGMAKEADWILFAPFRFDQAYLRNPLAYELSRRMGRWAPRTRQIELFMVEDDHMEFDDGDYRGVYTLIERIEPDENRLVIDRLRPEDNAAPEITGGYVFKVDRTAPGDNGFQAGGSAASNRTLNLVFPDPAEITSPQSAYLIDYIDTFAEALNAADFHHPELGTHYSEYIDVGSWIDHHILNLFTRNPDGLRLSAYFHKPREGKLTAGPAWDFDRTMGSTDGRDESPESWNQGNGNGFFTALWWGRLFDDPEFAAAYWARMEELTEGELSPQALGDLIDSMAVELTQGAAARNSERWPAVQHRDGHEAAVAHLRWWMTTRSTWIRDNLPAP